MTVPSMDVVVVGGGLVAATLARRLRGDGWAGSIAIVSDEPHLPYDRPPLSKDVLTGTATVEETSLLTASDVEDLAITTMLGVAATGVDTAARTVSLADGSQVAYAALVVASGARARRVDAIPSMPGVHTLRSRSDASALATDLRTATRVVVVGAGFVGLEVAAVARSRGLPVTIVESAPRPLARALGPLGSELVVALHTAHGVDFLCSTTVVGLSGRHRVNGVRLDDGTNLPADLVVVGVGSVPNTAWLSGSRIAVDDGVLCDATGRTADAAVFAAGDVARRRMHHGSALRTEHWQSAVDQAVGVSDALLGRSTPRPAVPYFWSDQYGQKIQFCGQPGPHARRRDSSEGPVVCFGNDGRLTGVLTVSSPRTLARGRALISRNASWSDGVVWLDSLAT